MASIHIFATTAEEEALNKLEGAMTASGLTTHPRRFVLAKHVDKETRVHCWSPNELMVYTYFNDGTVNEISTGIGLIKELRGLLDLCGWIAAEKLGLKDELSAFADIYRLR